MDFTNRPHHFRHIYRGMLDRYYSYYLPGLARTSYVQPWRPVEYSPMKELGSIDSILTGEGDMLRDKLANTSGAIMSRLGIHSYINDSLDYRSTQVYTEILDLERSVAAKYWGTNRQRSTLTAELGAVTKQKHDELVRCWESLVEPMAYFVHLFHQYKGLKTDRELVGRK